MDEKEYRQGMETIKQYRHDMEIEMMAEGNKYQAEIMRQYRQDMERENDDRDNSTN